MRDRTVLCGSASKAYAMTGWRCGWALAPAALVGACNALQSHSTSNVCSITQKAAVAALTGPQECVTDDARRVPRAAATSSARGSRPGAAAARAEAGGRVLPVHRRLGLPVARRLRTTAELAQALLDEARVAITPGEAFDAPGFLRLSYATSLTELRARHRPDHRVRRASLDGVAATRGRRRLSRLLPPDSPRLLLGSRVVGETHVRVDDSIARGLRRRRAEARPPGRRRRPAGRHQPRSPASSRLCARTRRPVRAARRRHRLHRRRRAAPRRRGRSRWSG